MTHANIDALIAENERLVAAVREARQRSERERQARQAAKQQQQQGK